MGQEQTAGGANHVRERLETTVSTDFEEEKGREVTLLVRRVLDNVETQVRVEAQWETIWRRSGHFWSPRSRSLRDVEGILLVALVILGEAFFEPLDPTGIE